MGSCWKIGLQEKPLLKVWGFSCYGAGVVSFSSVCERVVELGSVLLHPSSIGEGLRQGGEYIENKHGSSSSIRWNDYVREI